MNIEKLIKEFDKLLTKSEVSKLSFSEWEQADNVTTAIENIGCTIHSDRKFYGLVPGYIIKVKDADHNVLFDKFYTTSI